MRRRRIHPFLDRPGPLAIAHRGGAGDAPENTLPAFEGAIRMGYRYLETDAHVTRDGVVVAFHDARLDRVTDRSGAIAELTVADVEAADAGYVFSADGGHTFPYRGRGVRIPRLEELLGRWPEECINIDPKSDACVAPLVDLIERLHAWDRLCIGSFSDRRLRQIRARSGGRACTSMGPRAVAVARVVAGTGWEVLIADAQKVKGLAPLACKTDRIDARVLAELSWRDLVPAIWLPAAPRRPEPTTAGA
jgi:glycerophosphoryl diester phosphodiesterase